MKRMTGIQKTLRWDEALFTEISDAGLIGF